MPCRQYCRMEVAGLWCAALFSKLRIEGHQSQMFQGVLDDMLRGSLTALVTPFQKDGSLDEKAFRALVEWQIGEGTNGLVPVGTTGESPTLSHEEHRRIVKACVEVARGRVPVVAGAGSNSTEEAISLAEHAEKVGADAVLVVTPYYNKPNQRGLYGHFAAGARATRLPRA